MNATRISRIQPLAIGTNIVFLFSKSYITLMVELYFVTGRLIYPMNINAPRFKSSLM